MIRNAFWRPNSSPQFRLAHQAEEVPKLRILEINVRRLRCAKKVLSKSIYVELN